MSSSDIPYGGDIIRLLRLKGRGGAGGVENENLQ